MTTWIRPTVDCNLVAGRDSATTFENRRVKIKILDNDFSDAGPPLLLNTAGRLAKAGDVIATKKTPYGILKLVLAADGSVVFDPGKALLALKAGQIFKTGFVYSVTDSTGQLTQAVVDVKVKGLNSGPAVTSVTRSSTFTEALDASHQKLPATKGQFQVLDADRGDVLSAKVASAQLLFSGGALPAGSDVSNLASYLTFTSAVSDGRTKALSWTYDPPASNFDFLNAGETLVVVFGIRVSDGRASSPLQTIRVTIVGTNDGAKITGATTGTVTKNGDLDGSTETVTQVTGKLDVSDLDHGQSVFRQPDVTALQKAYGAFTFDAATGAWTYKLDHAKAQTLGAGEVKYETLTVISKDGTASETITVAVVGANEGPS